jgi:hypothetical protein
MAQQRLLLPRQLQRQSQRQLQRQLQQLLSHLQPHLLQVELLFQCQHWVKASAKELLLAG